MRLLRISSRGPQPWPGPLLAQTAAAVSPAQHLAQVRGNLALTIETLDTGTQRNLKLLDGAIQERRGEAARRSLDELSTQIELCESAWTLSSLVPAVASVTPVSDGVSTYRIGMMSLCAWHRELMPPEKELALSGVEVRPGEYYLDQVVPLTGRATAVTVEPDSESVYQALKRFQGFGYALRAYAHSQPGRGPEATRPSGRDLATQRALERHYRAIGLIFTEDGYLRAYSDQLPFRLAIYGTNYEVIDEEQHLYRLHLS
jgi:hypothetical protein